MARIKRLEVPGFWPIEKKTKKYTVTPLPGPHRWRSALTLAVILRDVLQYAATLKEVRELLQGRTIMVNGRVRRAPGFPVGMMDVVALGQECYRVLPGPHGLYLKRIDGAETGFTLRKIVNKTMMKKKRVQLHFHDGTTLLSALPCAPGDVAVFDLAAQAIKEIIRREQGVPVMVTGGTNKGMVGMLSAITVVKSSAPNVALITAGDRTLTLPAAYIFPVGKKEPLISIGEADE